MDISGTGRSGYPQLPSTQDMAAVLAARSSVAEMSSRAATQAVARNDQATAATASASAAGQVDLYL